MPRINLLRLNEKLDEQLARLDRALHEQEVDHSIFSMRDFIEICNPEAFVNGLMPPRQYVIQLVRKLTTRSADLGHRCGLVPVNVPYLSKRNLRDLSEDTARSLVLAHRGARYRGVYVSRMLNGVLFTQYNKVNRNKGLGLTNNADLRDNGWAAKGLIADRQVLALPEAVAME